MADSRLVSMVLNEGLGIVDIIKRVYPNRPDLQQIKPKMVDDAQAPKGYFPARLICAIFRKEFRVWKRDCTERRGKQYNILQCSLKRIEIESGQTLTSDDVIKAKQGGAGGGYSWIHPRLMTQFLQWACPVFAEEIIDVFNRYVAGDPSIISETLNNQNKILEERLAAANNDIIQKQQVLNERETQLEATAVRLKDACSMLEAERARTSTQLDSLHAEMERMTQEQRVEVAKIHEDLMAKQKDLESSENTRESLKRSLDADAARPLHVLNGVSDPLHATRYRIPLLHVNAAMIPRAMGIVIAQLTYAKLVEEVVNRINFPVSRAEESARRAKERAKLYEELQDPLKARGARARVTEWYYDYLSRLERSAIHRKIRGVVTDAISRVFGVDAIESVGGVDNETLLRPGHLWNPVSMQMLVSKLTKLDVDVEYCTEVTVERMNEIAHNFNEYCIECGLDELLVLPGDLETLGA